jgi:hypothetical protein
MSCPLYGWCFDTGIPNQVRLLGRLLWAQQWGYGVELRVPETVHAHVCGTMLGSGPSLTQVTHLS